MTTLYFEASDEDDLRKTGFSRATKDACNRKRGLTRLEKRIKAGRLTKSNINNRGYNKYLRLTGEKSIDIDYEKYNQDQVWDGLKGYITNCKLLKMDEKQQELYNIIHKNC
jgi:hypothetical protein